MCAVMLAVFAPVSASGGEEAARRFSLVTPDGKTEGRAALDLSDGPKIVVWASPSDPSAKAALEALGRDDTARSALMTRALFLAPGNESSSLAAVNEDGPYEYSVPYSAADWPEIKGAGPRAFFYTAAGPVCEADLGGGDAATTFLACMVRSGLFSPESRLDTAVRLTWLDRGSDDERDEAKRLVRSEAVALLKKEVFGADPVARMPDDVLKDAYRVVSNCNFYGPEKEMAAAQSGLLAELEKRGLANHDMVSDMHGVLLKTRRFGDAEAFRLAHPGEKLQEVPEIRGKTPRGEHARAVYFLETNGSPMRLRGEDMRGERVIIAARPGCHFADNALEAIEKDPRLLEVFEKHGVPLTDGAEFGSIGRWNSAHKIKYRLAVENGDWPEIDFSLSPTFYFMRDGAVVYTFNGWGPGAMDNVYRGLGYLFYGGVGSGKEEKEAGAPVKKNSRRGGPLGIFLKGLSLDQKYRFCSGMSYAGGIFAGAPFGEIKAALGDAAAERLRAYITGPGGAVPPAGAEPRTFGELLPGLGRKELARTCETISFSGGRFGGMNFSDIWALPGQRMTGRVMSFFSPPRKKKSE